MSSLDKMDRYVKKLSDPQIIDAMKRGEIASIVGVGELQRRIEMRKGASSAPRSTVADDIMGQYRGAEPQQAGIGSLVPREEAPEPQAMARGGIVRMFDGQEVKGQDLRPLSDEELSNYYRQFDLPESKQGLYRLNPDLPPASLEQIQGEISRRQYLGGQFSGENYRNAVLGQFNKIPLTAADIARQQAEAIPEVAIPPVGLSGPTTETLPPSSSVLQSVGGPRYNSALPVDELPSVGGQRINSSLPEGDLPTAGGPRINSSLPVGSEISRGSGIRGIGAGGGGAGGGGGGGAGGMGGPGGMAAGAPTNPLQEALQNMRSATEDMRKLYETAGKGPSTQERRQEAINMALLQAGLGMMQPGQSNALAAISRGAIPALQSLGEQFRYIRKEDKENIMDQLKIKNQEALNAFHQGTIGYHIYDTQVKENVARANQEARLAAAGARQEYQSHLLGLRERQIELQERAQGATAETRAARLELDKMRAGIDLYNKAGIEISRAEQALKQKRDNLANTYDPKAKAALESEIKHLSEVLIPGLRVQKHTLGINANIEQPFGTSPAS